jgi:DNA-binding winged helix-turn-helix (wHTH) protein
MPASESTARLEHLSSIPMPVTGQVHHEPRLDGRRAVQSSVVQNSFFERPRRPAAGRIEISFGSFCLLPTQFLLLERDKPVPLGSRALEILIALLERPGELVSKEELMARVWPNVFVESANLTVHMSALRRTLRDGREGNRFIINIPGRGYSFVTPVEVTRENGSTRPAKYGNAGAHPFLRRSKHDQLAF